MCSERRDRKQAVERRNFNILIPLLRTHNFLIFCVRAKITWNAIDSPITSFFSSIYGNFFKINHNDRTLDKLSVNLIIAGESKGTATYGQKELVFGRRERNVMIHNKKPTHIPQSMRQQLFVYSQICVKWWNFNENQSFGKEVFFCWRFRQKWQFHHMTVVDRRAIWKWLWGVWRCHSI